MKLPVQMDDISQNSPDTTKLRSTLLVDLAQTTRSKQQEQQPLPNREDTQRKSCNSNLVSPLAVLSPQYLTIILCLLLSSHGIQSASATAGECDFEKYATGCYSRANLYCDLDTRLCKCLPETPILIEKSFCLKRVKLNEACQYSEQCDNANGYYCSFSDYRIVNSSSPTRSVKDSKELYPKCIKIRHNHQQHQLHQPTKQDQKISPTSTHTSSRPIWLIIVVTLFGLIFLMLLIKSQQSRIIGRPFQHEDHLSIDSESDAPPSYDIAIRMKQ